LNINPILAGKRGGNEPRATTWNEEPVMQTTASTASRHATNPAPAPAAAPARYEIDPAHSRAQFAVRHMMVATVRGEFSNLAGTVVLDEADPSRSRIEATIPAATVDTKVDMRNNHLKSPDFFDVEKFPTISFQSTAVQKTGEETYAVTGDLTLHGVTKRVVLDVESPAIEVKDPYGNMKRGAVATVSLNRKDFGLHWNQGLEAGGVMVGDNVRVTIDLELARK
jgi:polyisoprenoid-binding protein YceI